MTALAPGAPAPWFRGRNPSNPEFDFDTVGGRFVLLAFLPSEMTARAAAMQQVGARRALFDEAKAVAFMVARDEATAKAATDLRGLRWFFDLDGAISRLYGALDADGLEHPQWILLDPTLRVLSLAPIDRPEALFALVDALPEPAAHAGAPMVAPVLVAPRIFEPALCQALIDCYEGESARFTGVMRDEGGETRYVLDELKRRRDVVIADRALLQAIVERLKTRLFPEIRKAFQYQVGAIERFIVSCYDAADAGVFHAHRDNTTKATARRRFACSINLNADFEGGQLAFPEYGGELHRPPLGGAVVFSCALLHEVKPMTRGRRFAFLPFFLDAPQADTA
ncbi:MAG: 2OG-Fe(II) oxygenase [Phenylobacterium sp.]